MTWIQDPELNTALIARYYGDALCKGDMVVKTIDGNDVYALRLGGRFHVLAKTHTLKSVEWVTELSRDGGVCTYCDPADRALFEDAAVETFSIYRLPQGKIASMPSLPLGYEVRALRPDEASAVEDLFSTDQGNPFVPGSADAAELVSGPNRGVFREGILVSFIGLFDETAQEVEVGRAVTAPAYRRRGLQAHLIGALCGEIAETRPRKGIVAWVNEANSAARSLFTKLGFSDSGAICVVEISQ